MTTLHTITQFLSGLISAALAFFAIYAFFILRRMERRLCDINLRTATTLKLNIANQLKSSINTLNDMQRHLRKLVKEEQYETAEQLRAVILSQEQNVLRQMEQIKKTFGDNVNIELHFMGEKNDNDND